MFEVIGTLANLNQDNPHGVQAQVQRPQETPADAAQGKVNSAQSVDNSSNRSDSRGGLHSRDSLNDPPEEGRIIELLG